MNIISGGVCAAKGFKANGVHCGIRKNHTKKDLALIVSDVPATAAAVYTTNLVKGAPLTVTKNNIADGIARLGDKVSLLHMKDFIPYATERGQAVKAGTPNTDVFSNLVSCACGTGDMDYAPLLSLAKQRDLPMTLENTNPANAVAAREHLEKIGASL